MGGVPDTRETRIIPNKICFSSLVIFINFSIEYISVFVLIGVNVMILYRDLVVGDFTRFDFNNYHKPN